MIKASAARFIGDIVPQLRQKVDSNLRLGDADMIPAYRLHRGKQEPRGIGPTVQFGGHRTDRSASRLTRSTSAEPRKADGAALIRPTMLM